jgi:hypothetical protein
MLVVGWRKSNDNAFMKNRRAARSASRIDPRDARSPRHGRNRPIADV